jgi:hypothetical protein
LTTYTSVTVPHKRNPNSNDKRHQVM